MKIEELKMKSNTANTELTITDGSLPTGGSLISRAGVAHFMITEAETPAHSKQIVGLAN